MPMCTAMSDASSVSLSLPPPGTNEHGEWGQVGKTFGNRERLQRILEALTQDSVHSELTIVPEVRPFVYMLVLKPNLAQ